MAGINTPQAQVISHAINQQNDRFRLKARFGSIFFNISYPSRAKCQYPSQNGAVVLAMSHADFAYIDLFISAQIYESRIEVIVLAWRFVSENSARRCK